MSLSLSHEQVRCCSCWRTACHSITQCRASAAAEGGEPVPAAQPGSQAPGRSRSRHCSILGLADMMQEKTVAIALHSRSLRFPSVRRVTTQHDARRRLRFVWVTFDTSKVIVIAFICSLLHIRHHCRICICHCFLLLIEAKVGIVSGLDTRRRRKVEEIVATKVQGTVFSSKEF